MTNGKTEVKVKDIAKIVAKKPHGRVTLKQKRLRDLIADNIRNGNKKSLGKLQREAGYSESTADAPSKVTKGLAWNELMDLYLPDSEVVKIHGQLLGAASMESETYDPLMTDEQILTSIESIPGQKLVRIEDRTTYGRSTPGKKREAFKSKIAYYTKPDTQTRIKAVAEAYKVKNKYKPQEVKVTNSFTKESLDHIRLVLGA